jgi:hypothetical protein
MIMPTEKSQLDGNNLDSYLKYGCEAAWHQPWSLTVNCTAVKQCDNSLHQIDCAHPFWSSATSDSVNANKWLRRMVAAASVS